MDGFIYTVFVVFISFLLAGFIMKHNQNQHWIEKINTWAIQQEYAGYDTKTGEIIYYDESIKELIEKD